MSRSPPLYTTKDGKDCPIYHPQDCKPVLANIHAHQLEACFPKSNGKFLTIAFARCRQCSQSSPKYIQRIAMLSANFSQRPNDYSIFLRFTSIGCSVLLLHVDNIIITNDDTLGINDIQTYLMKPFHMKDHNTLQTEFQAFSHVMHNQSTNDAISLKNAYLA